MPSTSERVDCGYTVIRMALDDAGENVVPVGVAGWNRSREWFGTRFLQSGETLTGVNKRDRHLIEVAADQLRSWTQRERVPFATSEEDPWTEDFWRDVSRVLTAGLTADSPKALDPSVTMEGKLDELFDYVAQPETDESADGERINGKITRALGNLVHNFQYRPEIRAFGGGRAKVIRGYSAEGGTVVVDGVNLARKDAEDRADALVSRVQRMQEAHDPERFVTLVGYTASPGGLNGETHMKRWIEYQLDTEAFDLAEQGEALQSRAREALDVIRAQQSLHMEDVG